MVRALAGVARELFFVRAHLPAIHNSGMDLQEPPSGAVQANDRGLCFAGI
jgi:hypothetical protein